MRSKFLKGYEWRQDGEYAWYMLMYYPVICKVDLRTNRINKHILIPNKYYVNTVCQYRHCIKKLNYLYCVPDFGKYILRYDELGGNFSAINLGFEGRFRDCYLKDNFLYMYSSNGARLLIVELEQFKVVDDIKIEENTAGFLSMSPSELGLWFACGNNSRIAYFGFEDRKVNYITLEGVEEAIVDIFISNDILFLGNGKNSIFMCKCNNISFIIDGKKISNIL